MENEIVLSEENIAGRIYFISGIKVMLDCDHAALYGVETRALKQQVKRNQRRFPEDFMFQLTKSEWTGGCIKRSFFSFTAKTQRRKSLIINMNFLRLSDLAVIF